MKAVLWRWDTDPEGGWREEYRPRYDDAGNIAWFRPRRDEHGDYVRNERGNVVLDPVPASDVPPASQRFFVDRHGLNFRVTFFCDDGCCPDPTGASGPEATQPFRIPHEKLEGLDTPERRQAAIDAAIHVGIRRCADRVRAIVKDSIRDHDEHCRCCEAVCDQLDDECDCGDDPEGVEDYRAENGGTR